MPSGRPELGIEVKATDRCPRECPHCVNRDGPDRVRDLDARAFTARLFEWAAGRETSAFALREARVTGGEPLLRPDTVLEIVRACRTLGLRSGVNTNGLLLTPALAARLADEGLGVAKISLDARDLAAPEGDVGDAALPDPVAAAARGLAARGVRLILRSTLTRSNLPRLGRVRDLGEALGAALLQLKPLVPAGRALDGRDRPEPAAVDDALRALARGRSAARVPVEVLCWPPVAGVPFRFKVCGSLDKLYVGADLSVAICNFVPEGTDAALGSLADEPLEAVGRRRLEPRWTEASGALRRVSGCPLGPVFSAAGDA